MYVESESEKDTLELAFALAGEAGPGDIVTLSGELGAGKTVFAKGFALGLGVEANVTSPTFTIVKSYFGARLTLHHIDAYRIGSAEEMEAIGFEEYLSGDAVTLIEWPELIGELIPEGAVRVRISRDLSRGESFRLIEIGEK